MTSTTYSEFGAETEGLDVAKAFANGIKGRTFLVTGVNIKGIGFTTAEALASQSPTHIIIAGRNLSKLQESIDALKAKYPGVDYRPLQLNLSSQKDVRVAASELLSWTDVPTIDGIVNSAGIMSLPERIITGDGVEMTFATNHVGHYLFTCLIMPRLIAAAAKAPRGAVRVVNVSSRSPTWASMRWSDMNFEKNNSTLPQAEQPPYEMHRNWGAKDPENSSYLPLESYNQSKVANVLFSISANARLYDKHGILSLAVHPGVIRTELGRNAPPEVVEAIKGFEKMKTFTWKTQGAGSATSLVAALDPKLGRSEAKNGKENWGIYLNDCQIDDQIKPLAESSEEAEKLWKLSERLVKQEFEW